MSIALKLIKGVAGSIWQTYQGGFVPERVAVGRLEHCLTCKHFHLIKRQCQICGCLMPAKVRIALAECPDKPPRWSKYIERSNP